MSLKDENLLDCDFDENMLSLMLENDFVVIDNVATTTKLVPKNVGGSSKVQDSIQNFLEKNTFFFGKNATLKSW